MRRLRWLTLALIVAFLLPVVRSPLPEVLKGTARWVALAVVVAVGLSTTRWSRALRLRGNPVVPGLAMLFAFAAASADGANPNLSYLKLVPLVAELLLALLVLPAGQTLADWTWLTARVRWLLTALCAAAATLGVFVPGAVIQGVRRLGGISNPNSVGVIAMLATLVWLWQWSSVRSGSVPRWLWGSGLALAVSVLWWTGSRSSIAGALMGFLVWAWIERLGVRVAVIGAAVYGLSLATVPTVVESTTVVAEERLKRGENPLVSREGVWQESIEAWRRRPWLGYGYGISAIAEVWEGNLIGSVGSLRDGSGYLGVLESVGVVGLVALGVVIGVVVRTGWRSSRVVWARSTAGVGLSLVIGLLVNAVGEPWLLGPGSFQQLMLWLSVAQVIGAAVGVHQYEVLVRQWASRRAVALGGRWAGQAS